MPVNVHRSGRDYVAVILAVGVALALNCIVVAVLWDAVRSAGPGLSENATQILTGAFGGIIGVLGSYLGYRAGAIDRPAGPSTPTQPGPPADPDPPEQTSSS